MNTSKSVVKLTQTAFLAALIILMTLVPFLGYIPLVVIKATTIHIPVIIGSIILGPKIGAGLGFLFGLTSLIMNTVHPALTSFVFSPFVTFGETKGNLLSLVVCFVPRILVGIVPYYVYKLIKKVCKSDVVAYGAAGFAGAMTNTLLVMNLIYLFFGEQYGQARKVAAGGVYKLILSVIGMNGVPEAIVAMIITALACKALTAFNKRMNK